MLTEQTDEQLLALAMGGDEDAFTALVQRHGPMVIGVCRRLLRETHDVEDAFQATFLVLAGKAASIRKGESVGSWLHGVALRVARKARLEAVRRSQPGWPWRLDNAEIDDGVTYSCGHFPTPIDTKAPRSGHSRGATAAFISVTRRYLRHRHRVPRSMLNNTRPGVVARFCPARSAVPNHADAQMRAYTFFRKFGRLEITVGKAVPGGYADWQPRRHHPARAARPA